MPSSYPPTEVPTFSYIYPTPSTVADYLAMTTPRRERPAPAVTTDEETVTWDALGDFA